MLDMFSLGVQFGAAMLDMFSLGFQFWSRNVRYVQFGVPVLEPQC